MALSGTRTFVETRNGIITMAYRAIGMLGLGDVPTDDMFTEAAEVLNVMQLSWQSVPDNIFLWERSTDYETVVADQASYTLDADIIEVRDVFFRVDGTDTPLTSMTLSEYQRLSDKDASGTPQRYYVDYGYSAPVLYLWPIYSDSGATVHYTKLLRLQDFNSGTDNPDFAPRWYRALYLNLAVELAPIWGKGIPADLAAMALQAKEQARQGGRESGNLQLTVRLK